MKISDFYDKRWKSLECRKDYEKPPAKLAYLRKEYELWALWIDKFYSGEHGIYTTLTGDAPRYALEDYMDFCYWDTTYDLNYPKRNHFANHKARAEYTVKLLTELFNDVDNYVMRTKSEMDSDDIDEDEGFNLNFQEMKEKMMNDPTYKQKWFKAAYAANDYIESMLNKNMRSRSKSQRKNVRRSKRKNVRSPRRSKGKSVRSRRRSKGKTMRSRRRSKSKSVRRSKGRKKRSKY